MEFQRERVYTSLNADELRAGDKVICANCMTDLKKFVQKETETEKLVCVLSENDNDRFYIGDNVSYNLAYLVERKENCTNCDEGKWDAEHKKILCDPVNCGNGNIIFRNHEIEVCEYWKPIAKQKAEKHYRPFRDTDELVKVWEQKWSEKTNGQKWHDCKLNMPLIWVRSKFNKDHKGVLINNYFGEYVELGIVQCFLARLFDEYTFLDGSPCGVEE